MRTPDFERDGWELDDGEQRHREAPATFHIPALADRQGLQPGDFAKLIFRMAIDNDEQSEAIDRMWVLVREVLPSGGYVGVLDNEPTEIGENDEFWLGAELPFEPRHVIAIKPADAASREAAGRSAPIPWSRD